MTRFEVTIRCGKCLHKYKRVLSAMDEADLERVQDPPCPKCKAAPKQAEIFDFKSGRTPAIGGSLVVKATDLTMQMTAEDYGMTDMKDLDKVGEGESAAPKLAPALQAQADSFFGGPGKRKNPLGMSSSQIMRAAVGGRFNTKDTVNPVALHAQTREKPPVNIVAGDGVTKGR